MHGSSPQILFPYFFRSPTSAFADLHMNVPLTVHSDLPVSTQLCDMFLCWDVRPANCYRSNGKSTLHTVLYISHVLTTRRSDQKRLKVERVTMPNVMVAQPAKVSII